MKMEEDEVDVNAIAEFMLMAQDGNRATMGKLKLAKDKCKQLKLPSIEFPECEINTTEMNTVGGFYDIEKNKITIFIHANEEKGHSSDYSFMHEFGHWIDYKGGNFSDSKDFPELPANGEVTEYAGTSRREAFAETFAQFMTKPDELKEKFPTRYEYMNNLLNSFSYEVY